MESTAIQRHPDVLERRFIASQTPIKSGMVLNDVPRSYQSGTTGPEQTELLGIMVSHPLQHTDAAWRYTPGSKPLSVENDF